MLGRYPGAHETTGQLRTELMVLSVAEVGALSYYGGLADAGPDPVVRAVAARIVADEHPASPHRPTPRRGWG